MVQACLLFYEKNLPRKDGRGKPFSRGKPFDKRLFPVPLSKTFLAKRFGKTFDFVVVAFMC